jgi:hypothetical protein
MDWAPLVISGIIGLGFGVVEFYIVRSLKHRDADFQELRARVNKHDEQFARMPLDYTLRDDFIREMQELNRKLDKIYDTLCQK